MVDFGAGTGDGAAAIARRLPEAQVTAFEASPFMIIAGRVQNAGVPTCASRRGSIEQSGLRSGSVDAVAITLVLHECPNAVKRAILAEVRRVLRPGGALVLVDTAQDDLHGYRGFYEPYRKSGRRFDPDALLGRRGFAGRSKRTASPPPLWTPGRAQSRVERQGRAGRSTLRRMRDSAERFFNRELSWLDFDRRVLELARDAGRPILERAKFLAIFSRNLDEFFQVRVSELQDLVAERDDTPAPDGLTPAAQLAAIRERVLELTAAAHETFERELRPALRGAGIDLAHWHELSDAERAGTLAPFDEQISPVLIPLGVDPTHPFPFVSGLSLSVGAFVQAKGGGPRRLARVKVPAFLPRWWEVGPGRYTPVEEVIRAHFGLLFPEDEVAGASFFRVTRDADLELDEERGTGDLVKRSRRGCTAAAARATRCGSRWRADLDPRIRDLLAARAAPRARRGVRVARPARPRRAVRALRARAVRAQGRAVDARRGVPRRARRGGSRRRRGVPHAARARRARAPPVRELRELGRARS